ncbi:hypothetical protein BCD67_13560 [Oscillatoriales cyanobacterium USR001]|nr:hypothetical protein BCD67_13560 [Oscillatoriales cyanobacterium USR001]
MNLDRQIQTLIDEATPDGTTPEIVAAIAPALKLLAQQLQHLEYYILQSLDGSWAVTTLSNRSQPNLEKRVIYAFSAAKDAKNASTSLNARIVTVSMPVTYVLFQMLALETIDSIIFFESSGRLDAGTEVMRSQVQNLIGSYLQEYQLRSKAKFTNLPPDIA